MKPPSGIHVCSCDPAYLEYHTFHEFGGFVKHLWSCRNCRASLVWTDDTRSYEDTEAELYQIEHQMMLVLPLH